MAVLPRCLLHTEDCRQRAVESSRETFASPAPLSRDRWCWRRREISCRTRKACPTSVEQTEPQCGLRTTPQTVPEQPSHRDSAAALPSTARRRLGRASLLALLSAPSRTMGFQGTSRPMGQHYQAIGEGVLAEQGGLDSRRGIRRLRRLLPPPWPRPKSKQACS